MNGTYRAAVDEKLKAACAVTYTDLVEMAPAADPEGQLIRRAEGRVGADDFAAMFQKLHGLKAVPPGADAAATASVESANLRRAAVIAFGTDPDTGWSIGTDSRAYAELSEEILRLDIGQSRRGAWGFVVAQGEGDNSLALGETDRLGRITPPDCPFRVVAAHMDIGEAVRAATVKIQPDPAAPENAGLRV